MRITGVPLCNLVNLPEKMGSKPKNRTLELLIRSQISTHYSSNVLIFLPLTLMNSEWPKLHRVLAILSATGLMLTITSVYAFHVLGFFFL